MLVLILIMTTLIGCTSVEVRGKDASYLSIVKNGYTFQKTDDLLIGEIQYFRETELNPCTYWTYFPRSIQKNIPTTMFVIPRTSATEEALVKSSLKEVVGYLEKYRMPGLIVNMSEGGIKLRKADMTSVSQAFMRSDLHLYDAVFNQYIPLIRESGYTIHDKIFLNGYSGGGSFAYKFALFYPEKVLGVVFGGAATIPMPLTKYGNKTINYPTGLNGIERYTGNAYDLENYRKIKFVHIRGELDNNQVVNNELYGEETVSFVDFKFSAIPNTREKVLTEIYNELGLDFTFITYPNNDHTIDKKKFHQQAFDIFQDILDHQKE